MAEGVVLDLGSLVEGPVQLATFRSAVDRLDVTAYQGRRVTLKGCAPTWAHLMVAGKLFGKASSVEFLLDNGKGGQPVEVFRT